MTRLVIGVSLLCLSGLTLLTRHQTLRFQSNEALWCHAASVTPDKPRALVNCASALLRRGGDARRALVLLDWAADTVEDPDRDGSRRAVLRAIIGVDRVLALVAVQRRDEARTVLLQLTPHPSTQHTVERIETWLR